MRGRPKAFPWLLLILLVAIGGCSRIGMEGGPAAPAPDESTRPLIPPPGITDRTGPAAGPTRIFEDLVEVDGIDPILHSVVRHDPRLTERVDFWIDFWTSRGADHFGRYIERMARYHGVVDLELQERGLPLSLRFLPVVESGYHHGAVSRVGATGLWQIMTPTARDLGLSVSTLVDDRRDPVLSTRAALDYLEQLHRTFDSWFLALAAYNAGQGRVARVLRDHAPAGSELSGDELFLLLRPHFPAETRDFVPRFFAAAILAGDPERFGFRVPLDIEALAFDEVEVPDATSFDVLARAAEVDEEEIRMLNPHYLRGHTPPGEARRVRVPVGRRDVFEVNFARIPPEERISFLEHAVARGETLTHIARRYSVPVADLSAANGNVDPRRLQVGQRLVVPIAGAGRAGVGTAVTAGADDTGFGEGSPDGSADPLRHRVNTGENLWTLARRYDVRVADLQEWNGLDEGAVIQPGTELVVGRGDRAGRSHRVRPGDTWGDLARRYGVRAEDLARANGRTTRDLIRIGENLRIP